MKTYPSAPVTPFTISTVSDRYSFVGSVLWWSYGGGAFLDTAWTANLAMYFPITLPWPYPINHFFWANTSTAATGNIDVGVYSAAGTKIYSTGAVAQSGTSVRQTVAVTNTIWLEPGAYYLAITSSAASHFWVQTLASATSLRLAGVLRQTGQTTLPSTMTGSTPTALWPIFGFSKMDASF